MYKRQEYTYKVVKSEIESDGDVELKTTEEVASFAATKTTVVKMCIRDRP